MKKFSFCIFILLIHLIYAGSTDFRFNQSQNPYKLESPQKCEFLERDKEGNVKKRIKRYNYDLTTNSCFYSIVSYTDSEEEEEVQVETFYNYNVSDDVDTLYLETNNAPNANVHFSMKNVKHLFLSGNQWKQEWFDKNSLDNLVALQLNDRGSITTISSLSRFPNIKLFFASNLYSLKKINLEKHQAIQSVIILGGCDGLKKMILPKTIETLSLNNTDNIEKITIPEDNNINQFTLEYNGTMSVESLFKSMYNLTVLTLSNVEIPKTLFQLDQLQTITLYKFILDETCNNILDLSKMKQLTSLKIDNTYSYNFKGNEKKRDNEENQIKKINFHQDAQITNINILHCENIENLLIPRHDENLSNIDDSIIQVKFCNNIKTITAPLCRNMILVSLSSLQSLILPTVRTDMNFTFFSQTNLLMGQGKNETNKSFKILNCPKVKITLSGQKSRTLESFDAKMMRKKFWENVGKVGIAGGILIGILMLYFKSKQLQHLLHNVFQKRNI